MLINKTIVSGKGNSLDVELILEKNKIKSQTVLVADSIDSSNYFFDRQKYINRNLSVVPILILHALKFSKSYGIEVLRQIFADKFTRVIHAVILASPNEEQGFMNRYILLTNSYVGKHMALNQFAEAVSHLGLYWLLLNEAPASKGDNC